jgi:hypothetical protein
MKRLSPVTVGIAIFAVLILVIWLISRLVQPFLSPIENLLLIGVVVVGVAAAISGLNDAIQLGERLTRSITFTKQPPPLQQPTTLVPPRRSARQQEPVASGSELAQAVRNAMFDSEKVGVVGSYMGALYDGQVSGEELADLLNSFGFPGYAYEALQIIAPKVNWPISSESRLEILGKLNGSGYEAKVAEILAQPCTMPQHVAFVHSRKRRSDDW